MLCYRHTAWMQEIGIGADVSICKQHCIYRWIGPNGDQLSTETYLMIFAFAVICLFSIASALFIGMNLILLVRTNNGYITSANGSILFFSMFGSLSTFCFCLGICLNMADVANVNYVQDKAVPISKGFHYVISFFIFNLF